MKTDRNPKMKHDFFTNLPTEIMIGIFMRLPVQSIMSCTCVCKSWRDLIKTPEFVDSQVPCLALFQGARISRRYKIIEFVDTQYSGQNQCNLVLNFSFPHEAIIHSSAKGLLLLSKNYSPDLFICNPITCEYVKLPPHLEVDDINSSNQFGFGVSKLTCEYKVVRLFYKDNVRTGPRKCEVYSLRRRLWRSVATAGDQLWYCQRMSIPISLNGNLHWLVGVYSENHYRRILCFDLETEHFSTFSIPHLELYCRNMCVFRDCLCLCDNSWYGFVIWLMTNHGDDKSWTKEFVIDIQGPYAFHGGVVPIKVFKDGDILFVDHLITKLCCYSSKTRTFRVIIDASLSVMVGTRPCIYTPNFLPLKTFTIENIVISF